MDEIVSLVPSLWAGRHPDSRQDPAESTRRRCHRHDPDVARLQTKWSNSSKYSCEGDDISPPLAWDGVPESAKSLVLIIHDPDAPDPKAPQHV